MNHKCLVLGHLLHLQIIHLIQLYGQNKNEYYYYDLEYPSGAYLYVSNSKDSVWFGIEGNEIFFETDSEEFEVQK